MQHAEFRRLFGADPRRTEPEVLAHRASCAECAKYAADLERVDSLVAGAFDAPAPNYRKPWELDADGPAVPAAARRSPRRWYALAAGLVLLGAIGLAGWFQVQRNALIAEVIEHAAREGDVMVISDKRVNAEKLHATLAKAGARLHGELPVSTARTCKIRGVIAPHLIMQTPDGAVALLLLSQERLYTTHSARKAGYLAELVPVGEHSIAVVGTSEQAVERGARMIDGAIDWDTADPGADPVSAN